MMFCKSARERLTTNLENYDSIMIGVIGWACSMLETATVSAIDLL